MKVHVKDDFWQLFPDAQISVLVVKGLNNTIEESDDPYFKALLDEGTKKHGFLYQMKISLRMK